MEKVIQRIIYTKKLLDGIYGTNSQHRVNPAPSPPAQYVKVCQVETNVSAVIIAVQSIISPTSKEPVILKAVIELMLLNGLRVSEVLSIEGKDISQAGHVYIKSKKGSNDRYAISSIYSEYWKSRRNVPEKIGDIYDRFFMYRYFKKKGIGIWLDQGKKKAITHALRHIFILTSEAGTRELEVIRKHVGHKSIKSTEHYARKKK